MKTFFSNRKHLTSYTSDPPKGRYLDWAIHLWASHRRMVSGWVLFVSGRGFPLAGWFSEFCFQGRELSVADSPPVTCSAVFCWEMQSLPRCGISQVSDGSAPPLLSNVGSPWRPLPSSCLSSMDTCERHSCGQRPKAFSFPYWKWEMMRRVIFMWVQCFLALTQPKRWCLQRKAVLIGCPRNHGWTMELPWKWVAVFTAFTASGLRSLVSTPSEILNGFTLKEVPIPSQALQTAGRVTFPRQPHPFCGSSITTTFLTCSRL